MKTKHLRLMQRAYVILFFCFMYLPIAYMVVFSFNQSKGYALFTGFTFKWYTSLLHNESILHALWVSLYLALFSAVIAICVIFCSEYFKSPSAVFTRSCMT